MESLNELFEHSNLCGRPVNQVLGRGHAAGAGIADPELSAALVRLSGSGDNRGGLDQPEIVTVDVR